MRLPGDNTLVDTERKALRDWRNYFLALEPASTLSATEVSALKALLTVQEEVDAAPPSVGSIPYQGAGGPTTVVLGTPGQFLGVNAQRTAPEWQAADAAEIILENETLPGTATFDITIPRPFKTIRLIIAGMSRATGGSVGPYSIALSGDGGQSWTASPVAISQSAAASETYDGNVTVDLADSLTGNRVVSALTFLTASNLNTAYGDNYVEAVTTGYINGIRLGCTSTFDAGTITVIGYK